jgi:hypothetical protein
VIIPGESPANRKYRKMEFCPDWPLSGQLNVLLAVQDVFMSFSPAANCCTTTGAG